jgi:hypothetical protein
VARVNRLKMLIREKQAKHREETGRNLPQHIMAVELGLDPATFSEYINSKTASVSWEMWQRFADYFGVQGHEIFDVTPRDDAK